jgi:hypothetical protein
VFANLQPELNRRDREHGQIVDRTFLIARGDATRLFQPIDQAFHAVAGAIDRAVKATRSSLVPFPRDGVPNMSTPQVLPNGPATIALVANDASWPAARLTTPDAFERALFHELLEDDRFVTLASSQDKGNWLATAFGTNVNFGAEAAFAAAQRFGIGGRIMRTSSVLMRAYDRSINIMRFPINLAIGQGNCT